MIRDVYLYVSYLFFDNNYCDNIVCFAVDLLISEKPETTTSESTGMYVCIVQHIHNKLYPVTIW